jgi:hypothetical protein
MRRPYGAGPDVGAFESAPPYTVRGSLPVFRPLHGTRLTALGPTSASTTTLTETYVLRGLVAGSYVITPQAEEALFFPRFRPVNVSTDVVAVDFKSFRQNALNLESYGTRILSVTCGSTNSGLPVGVHRNYFGFTSVVAGGSLQDCHARKRH